MRAFILWFFMILFLTACAGDDEEDAYVERPVDSLYSEAQTQLLEGNLSEAASTFEEVERQHPYSEWAIRGQIMAAYAYFLQRQYDESSLTLERFIELHPSSEYAAYAYYLRAMCYYHQITDVERDQKASFQALEGLDQVIARFEGSDYARDAVLKRDLVLDHLAGKEMEVGLYYLRQNEFSAAINRFRLVVENFQTTTHVPEALARLVETYAALGIFEESERYAAILQHNFSGNYWYEYAHHVLAGEGAVAPQANPQHALAVTQRQESEGLIDRVLNWF